MRKLKRDFSGKRKTAREAFYDLHQDWALIEASFAKQYGIRLRHQADMPWSEFVSLLSGLMPDTPLGSVVSIRAETDKKVIKKFSPEQRRIHSEWRRFRAESAGNNPEELERQFEQLSQMLNNLFGKGGTANGQQQRR